MNVERLQFHVQALSEADQGELGARIGAEAMQAYETGDRTDDHDVARSLLLHQFGHVLGRVQGAEVVEVHHELELADRRIVERVGQGLAGTVNQVVDLPELADDLVEHPGHLLGRGDVRLLGDHFLQLVHSLRLQIAFDFGQILFISCDHDHVGAVLKAFQCQTAADAQRTAGDHHHSTVQLFQLLLKTRTAQDVDENRGQDRDSQYAQGYE